MNCSISLTSRLPSNGFLNCTIIIFCVIHAASVYHISSYPLPNVIDRETFALLHDWHGLGPFADREIDSVLQIVLAAHRHDVLTHARVVLHHMRTNLCRGRATANRTRHPLRRRMPCKCFPHAQPCYRTIAAARASYISNCHCNTSFQHLKLYHRSPPHFNGI